MGPYDRRLPTPRSSLTWFYVDHPAGRLPEEGQRPEDVGCVGKSLQTLQLAEDGAGSAQAAIAAMPAAAGVMQQLVQQYAGKPDAVDMGSAWRDGSSRAQKLVASLLVSGCLWLAGSGQVSSGWSLASQGLEWLGTSQKPETLSFCPSALQSRLPAGQWDASRQQEFATRVQDT